MDDLRRWELATRAIIAALIVAGVYIGIEGWIQ